MPRGRPKKKIRPGRPQKDITETQKGKCDPLRDKRRPKEFKKSKWRKKKRRSGLQLYCGNWVSKEERYRCTDQFSATKECGAYGCLIICNNQGWH